MNSITSTVHKDSYMYLLHVHASSCSSIHTHMYVHLYMAVCTTHFIDGIVCTCTCICILNSLTFASLHKYTYFRCCCIHISTCSQQALHYILMTILTCHIQWSCIVLVRNEKETHEYMYMYMYISRNSAHLWC